MSHIIDTRMIKIYEPSTKIPCIKCPPRPLPLPWIPPPRIAYSGGTIIGIPGGRPEGGIIWPRPANKNFSTYWSIKVDDLIRFSYFHISLTPNQFVFLLSIFQKKDENNNRWNLNDYFRQKITRKILPIDGPAGRSPLPLLMGTVLGTGTPKWVTGGRRGGIGLTRRGSGGFWNIRSSHW